MYPAKLCGESANTFSKSVTDNEDVRWFCCLDQVRGSRVPISDGRLLKNDICIFERETKDCFLVNPPNRLNLFDFSFDHGTALVEELCNLFKMAKFFYTRLECTAKTCRTNVAISSINRKNCDDCISYRRGIVCFLIYLKNCCHHIVSQPQFKWLEESLLKKIQEELSYFVKFCGPISGLPDHIVNGPVKVVDNEPSYHVFHCHLDVKWLYITFLSEENYRRGLDLQEGHLHSMFESVLSDIISDLVVTALKRFNHLSLRDLRGESIFTCACVRQLWKLLQINCDKLNSGLQSASFWMHVNRVCEEIIAHNDKNAVTSGFNRSNLVKFNCTNPAVFIFWILKDLSNIYEVEKHTEMRSNYPLLENSLKLFLKTEASEPEIRTVLLLVENILKGTWEERTEPLALLWEYFHKRMNSSFLVPGASLCEAAIIGKNASGILRNLTRKLESDGYEENMDSFHLFLRLLGLKLRKWQNTTDGLRCWNQVKGRLLSKFSASKLSTFNEIGLYHFILVFLTLAVSTDSQEIGEKLQMFLQLLRSQELNESRMKLTLQAHMALILLLIKRGQDISSISNTVLAILEVIQNRLQNIQSMRIFIDEFHDLIDCSDNLQLGQYNLLGNWILPFLSSNCSESDKSRLLDSILLLITKLDSTPSQQLPIKQDCQLVLFGNALWEYVVPYLKTACSSSTAPYQVADIAAALTKFFLDLPVPSLSKSRAIDIFTLYAIRENVDPKLLCQYIGRMCQTKCIYNREVFGNNDIVLIRSWLRCLIVQLNDESNQYLFQFTIYVSSVPETRDILPKPPSEAYFNADNYYETFLNGLQSKYSSFEDFYLKSKLINQISSYFTNTDRWLGQALKMSKSTQMILNIYQHIGLMFVKIPQILYTKSKSNSLLQSFLDVMLLSSDLRNVQISVPQPILAAINKTIHLYLRGLVTLDPGNDAYIERCIRELIVTHIPRLMSIKGTSLSFGCVETSLCECFENSEHFEITSKTILEILCNTFLKKRAKIPHRFAFQALAFLESVIKQYRNDERVIISFMKYAFDRVCDVFMFCEIPNPSRGKAKNIVHFILKSNSVRNDVLISNSVIDAFGRLCREHLAFTSRNLFDFFEDIVNAASDIVSRFLPQFKNEIKQVENKRGVGYDRALRKGLERIEDLIKNQQAQV